MARGTATGLLAAAAALAFAAGAGAATPLIAAAKSGDRPAALERLLQNVDIDAVEPDGTTALMWAVHHGDAEFVGALLDAGADIGVENNYGATAMSTAAIAADAAILRRLLDAGADVDSPDPEGQTALMAVARTGRVEAAQLLLERGADVNAVEQWGGQTALMWASAQRQPDMVALLIEHGADIDARATVRDWQRLVTAEPRVKEMHSGGLTALLYAAREGCVDCARHLVAAGADVNLPDPDGVSPLVLALLNLRFDTAKYLVEAGADPNQWDWWGRSPLYAAIDMNVRPIGGRDDLPSTDDATALDVARMLLERGANPNIQLKLEPPLRSIVFDRGSDTRVLQRGATPLLRAAYGGDVAAVELLLGYDPLIELANARGITPIMAAAGLGHGGNPTRGRYRNQTSAIEAIELLRTAGGDLSRADAKGQTALHGAARKGWTDVVRHLAALGTDLEPRDENGKTPLDYALGDSPTVELVLGQVDPGVPRPETAAVLRELIAADPARQAAGRSPR